MNAAENSKKSNLRLEAHYDVIRSHITQSSAKYFKQYELDYWIYIKLMHNFGRSLREVCPLSTLALESMWSYGTAASGYLKTSNLGDQETCRQKTRQPEGGGDQDTTSSGSQSALRSHTPLAFGNQYASELHTTFATWQKTPSKMRWLNESLITLSLSLFILRVTRLMSHCASSCHLSTSYGD